MFSARLDRLTELTRSRAETARPASGSLNISVKSDHEPEEGGPSGTVKAMPQPPAYAPKRVDELLKESENLRMGGDDWERFWFLDKPSHLTPFHTHSDLGP